MHNFPKYKGGIASLTLVSFIPTITSEKRAIDGHFLSSVADDSKKYVTQCSKFSAYRKYLSCWGFEISIESMLILRNSVHLVEICEQ